MDKLDFPISKEPFPAAPVLAMDDYYRFVMESLELGILDLAWTRREKQDRRVEVLFRLIPRRPES